MYFCDVPSFGRRGEMATSHVLPAAPVASVFEEHALGDAGFGGDAALATARVELGAFLEGARGLHGARDEYGVEQEQRDGGGESAEPKGARDAPEAESGPSGFLLAPGFLREGDVVVTRVVRHFLVEPVGAIGARSSYRRRSSIWPCTSRRLSSGSRSRRSRWDGSAKRRWRRSSTVCCVRSATCRRRRSRTARQP